MNSAETSLTARERGEIARERCDCNFGCLKETGHLNEEKHQCMAEPDEAEVYENYLSTYGYEEVKGG